jgi:hypothetical protein
MSDPASSPGVPSEHGDGLPPQAGGLSASGDAERAIPGGIDRPADLRSLLRLLWDHAGRLSALFLGLLALLVLLFLAVIGSSAALVLLVVIVAGVAMIVVGGRIRA